MQTHTLNHQDQPIKGFCITNIGYQNDYDFSVYHRHQYYEIFLFDTGHSGQQNIDFVEYSIKEKNLYIVTPGQVHLLNRLKNEKGVLIQFTQEFLTLSSSPVQVDWMHILQSNPNFELSDKQYDLLRCIIDQLEECYLTESAFKTQKVSKLFAFFMFSLLDLFPKKAIDNKSCTVSNAFIRLVKKDVIQHRQVAYYADALGISSNKLGLETKRTLGKSPLKIIHHALILEIKRQLVFENKSHKQLAFDCYFDDLSTYSRFVKGQTGMNPTELKTHLMEIVNS